jgi:hypothetical protein
MSTIHRSRAAFAAFVAVLTVLWSAPIAVRAEDEVLAEEQVPVLAAVAAPAGDEPAANIVAPAITTQVPSDVRWAPDTGPAWLADSRAAAARRAAPAFPEWDAARWSPIEPSQSTSPDDILAALASGERTESVHLATVPLPGEAAVDGALTIC